MKRLLIVLLVSLYAPLSAVATESFTFNFDNGWQGWQKWGSGDGTLTKNITAAGSGAVFFACDSGEQITMHRKFSGLAPGRWKVDLSLRASEVGVGEWGKSIWIFYDVGNGYESAVTRLHGSFAWSRATFTVDVKKSGTLTLWVRLKAPGRLWVDEISLARWPGKKIGWRLQRSQKKLAEANSPGRGVRCPSCYRWWDRGVDVCQICGAKISAAAASAELPESARKKLPRERLFPGFDNRHRNLAGAPLKARSAGRTSRSRQLTVGRPFDIRLGDAAMKDWRGYDFLALDLYNPVQEKVRFSLTVEDAGSRDYWTRLNNYSTLVPGWNRLRFPLHRHVGERGSVRVKRYLDLGRIRRFWVAVTDVGDVRGQKKVRGRSGEFVVDNVRLLQGERLPPPFPGLLLFDFVKEDFRTFEGFTPIMKKHSYDSSVGFGFVDAKIWRAHDSLYADTLWRDGIFVNDGGFRVDLPKGRYVVRLVPEALGMWYEHFWTKRRIRINGRTVLDRKRTDADDYLDDFLRFSEVEPKPGESACELYLTPIFDEIVTEVDADNGRIVIDCAGDASGVLLNSLIIYPVSAKAQGEAWVKKLRKVQCEEFASLCRELPPPEQKPFPYSADDKRDRLYTAVVSGEKLVRWYQTPRAEAESIVLAGGAGMRPLAVVVARNLGREAPLVARLSPLQGPGGASVVLPADALRYAVQQFQSHSYNHETFELAPRFLRSLPERGLPLRPEESVMLWVQPEVTAAMPPGTWHGRLSLTLHGRERSIPVVLNVLDFTLPPLDTAIGFLGLDPVSFAWFDGSGVEQSRDRWRTAALKELARRGFTTWSSLPGFTLTESGGRWQLDTRSIDRLMKTARGLGFTHKVFSYGSPDCWLFEKPQAGLSADDYYPVVAGLLKRSNRGGNWLPIVVDVSDEAAGYSQKVERDTKRVETLRRYLPFFQSGGFAAPKKKGASGYQLNLLFDELSLSSATPADTALLKRHGVNWGLYNQAAGLFVNNRIPFGLNQYLRHKEGADHLLGWHLTGAQNYPYYDLDGREHDAMMLFPRRDGGLDAAIKFEWAAQGVEDYRLLLLLEKLTAGTAFDVGDWLQKNHRRFTADPQLFRQQLLEKIQTYSAAAGKGDNENS